MANEDILSQTLDSEEEKILGVSISIEDIRERITKLSQTVDGESLRGAMNTLKIALKSNPAACALLQPEEIGEMVKHLYKITDTVVLEEKKKSVTKASVKVNLNDPTIYDKLSDF